MMQPMKLLSRKRVPHSIYEIEGAMELPLNLEVFKTAGFTGPGVHIPSFLKGWWDIPGRVLLYL